MWKQTAKVRFVLLLIAGIAGFFAVSVPANAGTGINQQMAFEGKLVNASGTNVTNGTYNMEFKIYKNGTSGGGGTLQWTEDDLVGGTGGVTLTDGTFEVSLGANTSLGSVDWNSDTLWLSLQIGNTSSCTITTTFTSNCSGDGEMSPYIRLTAVPYAFNTLELGGVAAAGYGTLAGTQTWAAGNSFTSSITANGGLGITGLTTQSYGSAVNGIADSRTVSNSNASSTLSTVDGLQIQLVGAVNANVNKNVLNAINFPNVATLANNSFTGLNFGTGYNSLLSYNGNSVINGTGIVQTAFGGTGVNSSSAANGSLLIGNGTGLTSATLTNNGGVTISNGSGSIGLAVAYGSGANQAVQGNVTLTCPTVSGNLGGGGGTITLGTGGSCTGITFTNSPTFSGLTTANLGLTVTGGTADINSTGTSNTTIGNGTGTFTLNSSALDITSAGALSGITTISLSGAITGATSTNTINGLIINSGALSGISSIGLSGAISGGTSYSGSGNITTSAGNINATAGSLQTAGTDRITSAGDLANIGDLTATGASTFTATGANGFTFTSGINTAGTLAVQNSNGQNVLSIDTTGITNNLAPDPSIESTLSAANWTAHTIGTGGSIAQDGTTPYIGSEDLKIIVGTGTTTGGATDLLSSTLTASTQYNVFFYAKGNTDTATPTVIKAVYSINGAAESVACSNTLSLEYRTWQRYTCTFTTPASGITATNSIMIEATTASQTFYIDGVLVQLSSAASTAYTEGKITLQGTIASPVIIQDTSNDTTALQVNNKDGTQVFNVDTGDYNNLIDNPGFDVNTTGWTAIGTAPSIARDTSQQKFGLGSLHVVSGTAVNGGARYTLPNALTTGTYTISFSMLTTIADHSFIRVGYNNGTTDAFATCTNATVVPAASATQAANVWVRYSCTAALTTPASIIIDSATANKTFYIDGVQLETGSVPTAYGLGQIQLNATIISPIHLRNTSDSTNAFQVQNAAGAPLFEADTANMAVIIDGTSTTFVTLQLDNGHFLSTQTTPPTGAAATCGTTPTVTLGATSTDAAGSFTLHTGSGTPGQTCVVTITFNKAYTTAPKSVIITPGTGVNATTTVRVGSVTTTGTGNFTMSFTGTTAPVASTNYQFYYWVIE